MANTIVQIKRSQTSAIPASLQYGELGYSFQSGKIYIGDISNVPVAIGGNTYNQMLDAATSLNVANTIVKRNSSGDFAAGVVTATLYGNANTATTWQSARLIGVSGDATGQVSVNGSANANVPLTLANTAVSAGTYGGGSNVAIVTVDSKGRITYAANSEILLPSNSFTIAGDSGSDTFTTGGTLTFTGGDGVDTIVSNDTVTINVDSTVVRTSGNQTVGGNLTITGNLIVSGNTTTVDVSTLSVEDSLIRLANNNNTNVVDIGFYGSANTGTLGYYGIARTVSDNGNFFVFKGLPADLTGNTISSASVTFANTGTLRASLTGGTVSGLNSAIGVTDGGTGLTAVTTGDILYANGTNTLTRLSAVSTGNVLISGASAPSWGKVSLTSHITGTLSIANGGTNNTAIGTAGSIAYSDGTRYTFTEVGTAGQALTSAAASSPVFGTLDLRGGGLGLTSSGLLANSVIFYSGSGNVVSRTGTPTDGQVLQYSTAAGVAFGGLDGGLF